MNQRALFLFGLSLLPLVFTVPWSMGAQHLCELPLWVIRSVVATAVYAFTVALALRRLLTDDPSPGQPGTGRENRGGTNPSDPGGAP